MAILRKSLNLDFVKMANQLGVVNDPIVAFTRASTATRVNPTTGAIDVIGANLPCLTAACNLAAGVASAGATYLGGMIIAGASGGRAADVASVDVTKIWNVAATVVCQVDFGAVSGANQTAVDGTADAGIYVYRAADGSIKILIRSGGATIAQATIAGQYTRANVAVCVEGNTCRYAVNGAVATMAISTVPAATVMRIGATYGGADVLNGTVQSVSYMPYALDAYTLRAITTTTGGSEALPVSPSVFNFLGVVGTQAAMLSLGGKKGDWCIRSDTGTNWIITGTDPTSITSWAQIPYPASPVTSVAGRTGAVVLTKADVGLDKVENTALSTWWAQLGAITGKTYNGLTLTAGVSGFSIAGGTTSKTLNVNGNVSVDDWFDQSVKTNAVVVFEKLNLTTPTNVFGIWNSTNAQGGYVIIQTNGVAIGDFGAAYGVFGSANSAADIALSSRAGALIFGTQDTERARFAGTAFRLGTVNAIGYNETLAVAAPVGNTAAATFKNNPSSDATYPVIELWNTLNSANTYLIQFRTGPIGSATAKGAITYNSSSGQIQYNVTSDYRAKTIKQAFEVGDIVDRIPVYLGRMNGATEDVALFVAHEVQAVIPWAVAGEKDAMRDGKPQYQQLNQTSLIAPMWAELQNLRRRVAQLEAA